MKKLTWHEWKSCSDINDMHLFSLIYTEYVYYDMQLWHNQHVITWMAWMPRMHIMACLYVKPWHDSHKCHDIHEKNAIKSCHACVHAQHDIISMTRTYADPSGPSCLLTWADRYMLVFVDAIMIIASSFQIRNPTLTSSFHVLPVLKPGGTPKKIPASRQ